MKKRILYFVALFVILMFPTKLLADNGIGMYRLYNPNSGEHFYTASIWYTPLIVDSEKTKIFTRNLIYSPYSGQWKNKNFH